MPIHPEMRDLYPLNLPAIIRHISFERANNTSEWGEV